MDLLVDVHEPLFLKKKLEELGLPVKEEALQIGDYIIGDILIERKDIRDFFSSLRDGRLWSQLYNMKESNLRGYLVVIGDVPKFNWYKKKPITKEEYLHKLKTLEAIEIRSYLSYGLGFKHLKNNEQFIKFLLDIWNYSGKGPSTPQLSKKERSIEKVRIDMLSRIPGIGWKTAEKILEGRSIKDLCMIPSKNLYNILIDHRRLGEKRGKILKEVLGGRNKE